MNTIEKELQQTTQQLKKDNQSHQKILSNLQKGLNNHNLSIYFLVDICYPYLSEEISDELFNIMYDKFNDYFSSNPMLKLISLEHFSAYLLTSIEHFGNYLYDFVQTGDGNDGLPAIGFYFNGQPFYQLSKFHHFLLNDFTQQYLSEHKIETNNNIAHVQKLKKQFLDKNSTNDMDDKTFQDDLDNLLKVQNQTAILEFMQNNKFVLNLLLSVVSPSLAKSVDIFGHTNFFDFHH